MNSFKYALSLFIICFLMVELSSCYLQSEDLKSENCTVNCNFIQGRLLTGDGTKPVANKALTLYWQYGVELFSDSRVKARTTTDDNGNFTLKYLVESDETGRGSFVVNFKIDTAVYTRGFDSFYCPTVKPDTTITVNAFIPEKAMIKCNAINLPVPDNGDKYVTYFSWTLPFPSADLYQPSVGWTGYGIYDSPAQSVVSVPGELPIRVVTTKISQGDSTVKIDTVRVPQGQVLKLTFDFLN